MCCCRKTFISSLINKNFWSTGNIHFRIIDYTSNLTIILRFFNFRKINFSFRWTLIITLIVANWRNIGFMAHLHTSFSYFETSMHFLIDINHFVWLNRSSFHFEVFFRIVLIQKAKETLMMIWIRIFVYNAKTVADSSWNLSSHKAIIFIIFVSVLKLFATAGVKLLGFIHQGVICVWKANSTWAFFVD